MWGWVQRNSVPLLVVALALSIDWGISSLVTCTHGEQEQAQQCAEKYYGLTESISFRFIAWVLGGIRDENELVVAAATIIIAIFTVTLWRSTDKMWNAGEKQRDLAERTAALQLRAYVHVKNIKMSGASGDENPLIRVQFVNYGQTPAYQVRSRISSTLVYKGPLNTKLPDKKTSYSDLGPSQDKTTLLALDKEIWKGLFAHPIKEGFGKFYVFGEISYLDAFQARTTDPPRVTRYCFHVAGIDSDGNGIIHFSEDGNESN